MNAINQDLKKYSVARFLKFISYKQYEHDSVATFKYFLK